MDKAEPDAVTDGGQDYIFRGGQWTTKAGYLVSTTFGHALTMKFYKRYGRSPVSDPVPTPAANARAATAKRARVRAAVAKVKRAKAASAEAKATG